MAQKDHYRETINPANDMELEFRENIWWQQILSLYP